MILPEFLEMTGGEVRWAGHRVGLYHVVCPYVAGHSVEMIAAQMPTLPLALIHKVIAFYPENQDEVAGYIASYEARVDSLQAQSRRVSPAAVDAAPKAE